MKIRLTCLILIYYNAKLIFLVTLFLKKFHQPRNLAEGLGIPSNSINVKPLTQINQISVSPFRTRTDH